ncbi:MAG TPA: DUF4190 domain-containing protein [Phycisphaerae bacterium]|nr:DUF4190 domain-containing protein [Phycisphaerae bacterium]
MTYSPPNQSFGAPPARRKMSLSALFSLIFGILGCIPFIGGALAILFAIIGFIATGNPAKSGRWMAIVGLLLGIMSIGGWTLFGGGIYAIIKGTEGPRIATHDFIKAVADGDQAGIKAHSAGISDDELKAFGDSVQSEGGFVDTTFFATNISNDSAQVEGIAEFKSGKQNVTAELEKRGGDWKVTKIRIRP